MAFLPFSTVFFRDEKFVILYYTILEPSCHPFSENVRRPEGAFAPKAGDRGCKSAERRSSSGLCFICRLQMRGIPFRTSLFDVRVANPRKFVSGSLIKYAGCKSAERRFSRVDRYAVCEGTGTGFSRRIDLKSAKHKRTGFQPFQSGHARKTGKQNPRSEKRGRPLPFLPIRAAAIRPEFQASPLSRRGMNKPGGKKGARRRLLKSGRFLMKQAFVARRRIRPFPKFRRRRRF